MSVVRTMLAEVAKHQTLGPLVASTPLGLGLVERIAGGDGPEEAMTAVIELTDSGRFVALERSWSDAIDLDAAIADHEAVISLLGAAGLGSVAEIAVGSELLALARGREAFAELCAQAQDSGASVTLAADSPESVDEVLATVRRQQAVGREVGVVLQASLRRTERDCADLGGRVRIVKGTAGGADAFGHAIEVDKSFVRCAKALLRRGDEVRPSFATHDGRLIEIIETLAARYGRDRTDMEFAVYLGRSGAMQQRLIDAGQQVRVYVPFGPEWFGRLVGGLAEHRGVGSAVRSLIPGA